MNFASDEFLLFLPLVFALHWSLGRSSAPLQNGILLAASYVFYGWWDYRFLGLILLSSACDFLVARRLAVDEGHRRAWLTVSIAVNLGILGLFKYLNFFIDSAAIALNSLGLDVHLTTLQWVLPVGISFYTFQTLGYTLDVYHRRIEPCDNPLVFFTFVAFFPQLVAGPIERASRMLKQFQVARVFNYSQGAEGFRWILWGFFKKLVIADNCAPLVEHIWNSPEAKGPLIWLAALLFGFQIYADFSGYSDLAVGCAKLFGIELSRNFHYPYFAKGLRDFWQRWHISLSEWFRDYVYIPLGGNRHHLSRNILLTFLLSGLWHGAGWTFLIWGLLHGLGYLAGKGLGSRLLTFLWVTLGWVFFRAPTLDQAIDFLARGLQWQLNWQLLPASDHLACALFGLVLLLVWEGLCYRRDLEPVAPVRGWSLPRRWFSYLAILAATYLLGNFRSGYDFIYFQF